MKVAYYSPMPPERSGIADYSALLLPALQERIDVQVVRRGRTRPARGTDLALYHVGNNPDAHGWIVDALRKRPGVVVLHDFVLHHLVAGLTIGRRDGHGYLDAMEREGGVVGRLLGARCPRQADPTALGEPTRGLPPGRRGARPGHGSDRPLPLRRGAGAGGRVRGPDLADPAPRVGGAGGRAGARRGQPADRLVREREREQADPAAAGGVRAPAQRAGRTRGFCSSAPSRPGFDLERRLQRLGLSGEGIVREAYVEEDRLWALMAACDVCVNLRAPTMGETSGSVIRQLSLGKPVVVSDVGWFAELPDSVALKVPVDARETETLYAALELLARDEAVRAAMSSAALELVRREHDLARGADLYVAALEQAAGGEAVADAVLGDVAAAATDVGIEPGSPEAAELARRLAEVELGR